jgi:hypothetical protein
VRLSAEEACYACALTPHQRSMSDLPWSCSERRDGGPDPASIATTALVASWLTLAALRLLLGEPPPYRVLSIDGTAGRTAPVAISRDPGCPHHRPLTGPVELSPVGHETTVAEFLGTLPSDAEPLTWTAFPLPRRCAACGDYPQEQKPHGEPYGDQDVISCERCGALIRPRSGQRLRDAGRRSQLADLGVAPEEILPVRAPGGEYTWLRLS